MIFKDNILNDLFWNFLINLLYESNKFFYCGVNFELNIIN